MKTGECPFFGNKSVNKIRREEKTTVMISALLTRAENAVPFSPAQLQDTPDTVT